MSRGNEPAYPSQPLNASGMPTHEAETGISLREHFAGLAMQGLCAALADDTARQMAVENALDSGRTAKQQIAFAAVEYADALLAELAKVTP